MTRKTFYNAVNILAQDLNKKETVGEKVLKNEKLRKSLDNFAAKIIDISLILMQTAIISATGYFIWHLINPFASIVATTFVSCYTIIKIWD